MKTFALALFVSHLIVSLVNAQSVSIANTQQTELVEGRAYTVFWQAGGAETVNIFITGIRTQLGGKSRGDFRIVLAKGIPAVQSEFKYTLPWIDAVNFTLKVKGYDSAGKFVSEGSQNFGFRPAVLANRLADGIYLDLHQRVNQRLYVEKNHRIIKAYLASSSERYDWLPKNLHISVPHDHAGVFKVLQKKPTYYSSLYHVEMPWAMRYLGGHFIHATSSRYYRLLGTPASHGCNRLTRSDAHDLYEVIPAGTRVEVIGPKG